MPRVSEEHEVLQYILLYAPTSICDKQSCCSQQGLFAPAPSASSLRFARGDTKAAA